MVADDVRGAQVSRHDAQELRDAGQSLGDCHRGRSLVARRDRVGVSHRPQHLRRRRPANRADAPQLRQVEVEPAVERLHHRSHRRIRRDQRTEVLTLGAIRDVLEGRAGLR